MTYARVGLLAIVLHVIINADTLFRTEKTNSESRRKYRIFLFAVLAFYISDTCWGVFLELKKIVPAYVFTLLFFISMVSTVYLWLLYIRAFLNQKNFWSNVLLYVSTILFAGVIVIIVINFFTPIMFSFSAEGEYHPSQAREILLDMQILLFNIVGVYTLIRALILKNNDRSRHITIGISGLLMAFFIWLQARYPMTPFYSMGLLIATSIIHTFVLVDARVESAKKLGSYMRVAYKDALTNVRNVNAYTEVKEKIEKDIKEGKAPDFGVAVFDLNNLKLVNDTLGHEAGDKYIQDSCQMICSIFKHSPVFRIGGDEFVAILYNDDYRYRDALLSHFNEMVDKNQIVGGPVIAAGISLYDSGNDTRFDDVFTRADSTMYTRKRELKMVKEAQSNA